MATSLKVVNQSQQTQPFANVFGGLQGTAPQLQGSGVSLQGGVSPFNATSIAPPAAPKNRFSNVAPDFNSQIVSTTPSNAGPAPSFNQVYNGKVYTDPNALAQAQAANAFAPRNYNGQVYTDPNAYINQVISDVKSSHDKTISQINQAYQNGLIDFDSRQQAIEQNRSNLNSQLKSALSSQAGYFSSISPNASQSQEGVMANQTNQQYQQDLGNLNTSSQQLGTARGEFSNNYQNSLQAADQAQSQGIDQAQNQLLSGQANVQSILDAGKNAALDFQNRTAAYNSAAGAKTTAFDPLQLTQSLAGYLINAQQLGLPLDQAASALQNQLKAQGLNPSQTDPILQYAYGQVNDPNTPYGNRSLTRSITLGGQ